MRFNPFSPGGLVPPGVFTGRTEEIDALERMLFQAKNGNPQHFLVHGERGIGKSSLLYIHELSASGQIGTLNDDVTFNFLTISVILESAETYESIIRKLGAGLRRGLSEHQKTREMARNAWDFLKRWEIMGVKYRSQEPQTSPSEFLDELAHTYETASVETVNTFDGILVLIDEADKPRSSAGLGAFLKGFSERLARTRRNNIAIGVAGVSTVLETLSESHESALRTLRCFNLKPLAPEERVTVIRRGIAEANETNSEKTTITPEAEGLIAMFSEGYPHFIQQFAFSAFEADADGNIDVEDVKKGAWGEHGAFEQLGTKYFEGMYFDKVGSDQYRLVLQAMSVHLDEWVTKEEIRKTTKLKETTLGNALKALVDRHIILTHPGQRGIYRLPMKSFAAWIRAYTTFPGADPETPPADPEALPAEN